LLKKYAVSLTRRVKLIRQKITKEKLSNCQSRNIGLERSSHNGYHMATIADFRPSVSQMSEDDLLNHIRTIRSLRRMIPEKAVRKTKTKKASGKKKPSIKDHLKTLSENERQAMLQLLLKKRKEA
jgi:prenyltransferase beta subunit